MFSKLYNYTINLINNQLYNRLYNKIIDISLFLFILSLFFPIRYGFITPEAYLTGQYSDFTSFSLYLSDILLFIIFFAVILPRGREIWSKLRLIVNSQLSMVLLSFWLILGLILHFSNLTLFWTIKWLGLIVAYETAKAAAACSNSKFLISNWKSKILGLFIAFSSIQSLIALLQFWKQESLGLYRLGESHLGQNIGNVAKIFANGDNYIHGYGTFPHPNLLGAFFVTGIILVIYLFINSSKKAQYWLGIALFINILGLSITFSRAAYLALAFGLLIFFGFIFFYNYFSKLGHFGVKIRLVIIILALSSIFSFLVFRPFLMTRVTLKDNAITERIEYNNIAFRIIKENPFFGVGIGESVLHMQQYSQIHLQTWQKQPIHNYFLLSAAELGIFGALILIWIFILHFKALIFRLKFQQEFQTFSHYLLFFTILCTFLVLMFFDHYFYTLQQTRLLFWLTSGIIVAITKKEACAS